MPTAAPVIEPYLDHLVRFTYTPPQTSGNRKGWAKHVTRVNLQKTDGYAFEGAWINADTETDLPKGAIVVQQVPTGSNKSPTRAWQAGIITAEGPQFGDLWTTASFLTFRDHVAHLLASAPPDPTQAQRVRHAIEYLLGDSRPHVPNATLDQLTQLVLQPITP